MRANSIIYLDNGETVKIGEKLPFLLHRLSLLRENAALDIQRVTDHGSVKRMVIPKLSITRVEEL